MNNIWRPFTQEKITNASIKIEKGEGINLYDKNDNKYKDLISSWWVNLHGHGNKKIADAIYNQALRLEQVIFADFIHESAIELCNKLEKVININNNAKQLNKFFFSDNGSTATEIAIKVCYQYWVNQGIKDKKIFLSLKGDYHGDTFGAMSASKTSEYHKVFEDFFIEFKFIDVVYYNTECHLETIERKEQEILINLERYLKENHNKIAGFICEPIIQGAIGMKIYRVEFLNQLVQLLRKYNILIILDEVMTGFGRTGKMFAFHHCNFTPDIICLSKGLTGGFLPMGLTVFTTEIYNQFLSDNYVKAFAHGHSYTGNPLGCAAALASLEILLEENTQSHIQKIENIHENELKKLNNKYIKNKRFKGTIAAFTTCTFTESLKLILREDIEGHREGNLIEEIEKIMSNSKDIIQNVINSLQNFEYINRFLHKKLYLEFLKNGLFLRPICNEVYLIPPYCITEEELQNSYQIINSVITKVYNEFILEFFHNISQYKS